MSKLSVDEIRKRFESSNEFNEIFDAFQQAIHQRIDDIELYRQLFWNHSLTPDELCLFGEKLARDFQSLAYDTYMWLANVFEVTYSMFDNYKLALEYYAKAAAVRPSELAPYLDAADCYEPDLNIPPIDSLLEFLRLGEELVHAPKAIYQRLAYLYSIVGDHEQSEKYRRKADEGLLSSGEQPPAP